MKNIKGIAGKVVLNAKRKSPEIFLISGIVGMIGTCIVACRQTTKLSAIMEKAKEDKQNVDAIMNGEINVPEDMVYGEEEAKKDLKTIKVRTAFEVGKLYFPAIVLGTASVLSLLNSHRILRGRNAALAAAYASLNDIFKDYRKRVVDKYGVEEDQNLRYGIETEEKERTTVDKETGELKKEKVKEKTAQLKPSDYARFFDENNKYWSKSPFANLTFLKQVMNEENDKLRSRGYLFLNEVYDDLGFMPTKMGQVLGWIYDSSEDAPGDGFVDFGIYDIHNREKRKFVNGEERSILLDFNFDGDISNRFVKEAYKRV